MVWDPSLPQDTSKIRLSAGYIRSNWAALNSGLGSDVNLGIASGTKMFFYQDTAPTGWTIVATAKDALLAVKADTTTYTVVNFSNSNPGVITLDTSDHGFALGMSITTSGITQSGSGSDLNGDWLISSVAGSAITITTDTSSGYKSYSSGGTLALSTSSIYTTGGTMKGTWQQPDHTLTAAEMEHNHLAGGDFAGNSGAGSPFRAYLATTSVGGAINGVTASAHNHGTTYRPYAAVGIICQRT